MQLMRPFPPRSVHSHLYPPIGPTRPHHHLHRPPPVDHPERRRDRGLRARPGGGAGQARGADGAQGGLLHPGDPAEPGGQGPQREGPAE